MIKKIKEWFIDKEESELVDIIIKSMSKEPNRWSIDKYEASYGDLKIWISNSPYADMNINGRRLPRRGELRKALAKCLILKARTNFK